MATVPPPSQLQARPSRLITSPTATARCRVVMMHRWHRSPQTLANPGLWQRWGHAHARVQACPSPLPAQACCGVLSSFLLIAARVGVVASLGLLLSPCLMGACERCARKCLTFVGTPSYAHLSTAVRGYLLNTSSPGRQRRRRCEKAISLSCSSNVLASFHLFPFRPPP